MQFDNPVKIAFIISVFFHSFLFFALPAINMFLPKRPARQFEINYYRFKDYHAARLSAKPSASEKMRRTAKMPAEVKQKNAVKVKAVKQEQAKKEIASKNDSIIPPVPAAVQKSPAYLDYAQSVRERINRTAHYRYQRMFSGGEALVNFVLFSDGSLYLIKVIDERSTPDELLKKTAQAIIEDSSPFEPFPPDLEFKQLSFSLTISFE